MNVVKLYVTSYEQSGNATIKRLINREGNTSRWQVNGRDVSQKQVRFCLGA